MTSAHDEDLWPLYAEAHGFVGSEEEELMRFVLRISEDSDYYIAPPRPPAPPAAVPGPSEPQLPSSTPRPPSISSTSSPSTWSSEGVPLSPTIPGSSRESSSRAATTTSPSSDNFASASSNPLSPPSLLACYQCERSITRADTPLPTSSIPGNCLHIYCWTCLDDMVFGPDATEIIPCLAPHCDSIFTEPDYLASIAASRRAARRHKRCVRCKKTLPRTGGIDELFDPDPECDSCRERKKPVACCICMDDFPQDELPIVTANCTHDAICCQECLTQHLENEQSTRYLSFRCPFPNCLKELEYNDVERVAPELVFKKYDAELTRKALRDIDGFAFCAGDGCSYGEELDKVRVKILKCARCEKTTCLTCDAVHEDVTCEQYKRGVTASMARSQEDQASGQWTNANAKSCPNPGCGRLAWRETGCDLILCSMCQQRWCWNCRRLYLPTETSPPHYCDH